MRANIIFMFHFSAPGCTLSGRDFRRLRYTIQLFKWRPRLEVWLLIIFFHLESLFMNWNRWLNSSRLFLMSCTRHIQSHCGPRAPMLPPIVCPSNFKAELPAYFLRRRTGLCHWLMTTFYFTISVQGNRYQVYLNLLCRRQCLLCMKRAFNRDVAKR
jgi:hypothetical protein